MRDHDLVAFFIAEFRRDTRPDHRFEDVIEPAPVRQRERLATAVLIVFVVRPIGAEHREAVVRVAERDRHRPGHGIGVPDVLIALPAHVVGGVADPEHRVQQQVQFTGAAADDQVGTRQRVGETGAGVLTHPIDGQQQAQAERHHQQRQHGCAAPVVQALPGEHRQGHVTASRAAVGLRVRLWSSQGFRFGS